MTYTGAVVLGVLAALLVDLAVLRTRLVTRRVFWATYPIVLAFQLLSNGVLAGRGVVRYDPAAVAGPRVGYAPVEDLFFGFALVLLTLSTWVWLGRRGVQRTPRAGDRGPGPAGRAAGSAGRAAGGRRAVTRYVGWRRGPVR